MDQKLPLQVRYNTHYNTPRFPNISKPTIVGYFSINENREYIPTDINLKYLKLPRECCRFDLNTGYGNAIRKPQNFSSKELIDHVLRFILHEKSKLKEKSQEDGLSGSRKLLNADFICYRGLLRRIMTTPYEYREDWIILATKYKGNIYLCGLDTEAERYRNNNETEDQRRFCSYGFKFEQCLLTDDPNQEPDTNRPVNEAEEFCCMFTTQLEQHKLLFGAEIDGVASNEKHDLTKTDPNTLQFVELKVTRYRETLNQKKNFEKFKLNNWWCQSFLVGIQQIFLGNRNEGGILEEIDIIDMRNIPKIAAQYWSPAVCLDVLNRFLSAVKDVLQNTDCPYTVYEFYWCPKRDNADVKYKINKGRNNLTFLRDWYLKEILE